MSDAEVLPHQHQGRCLIAAGMQRSGTRWYCNMLVDIVGEVTGRNSRDLRREYGLENLLQAYLTPTINARLTARQFRRLQPVLADGHTLVFKTHRKPSTALIERMLAREALVTYIYRDPRKVLISAMQRGAKARSEGALPIRSFARLTTFDRALRWLTRRLLPTWEAWSSQENVMMFRYEDLKDDPHSVLAKSLRYFQVPASGKLIDDIIAKYQPANIRDKTIRRALDQDKDDIDKFRITLLPSQEERLNSMLGATLEKMGYL